jgi:hypothetical protein
MYLVDMSSTDVTTQVLCFWTLSIVLFLFKTYVSDTGFCIHLQIEPTRLGPIDRQDDG